MTIQDGATDQNDLEEVVACLFCGCGDFDVEADAVRDLYFHADDGAFRYVRCRQCASVWLNARPTGLRLMRAYAGYYTHAGPQPDPPRGGAREMLRSAYLQARFAEKAGPLDHLVASATRLLGRDNSNVDEQFRFAPKAPARILDYGCGSGGYLLKMAPFGHKLHGVEYDPQLLTKLAERGITIDDVATLTDDRWHAEFDHITLAHVLEHVPNPAVLLSRLFGWLKPGGSLFVELPNADATGLAIFGRYWRGLEAPRHFSLPNRAALIDAFGRAGLQVVRQHICNNARERVWDISLQESPEADRPALIAAMAAAPTETEANAEFLTFVAQRPA